MGMKKTTQAQVPTTGEKILASARESTGSGIQLEDEVRRQKEMREKLDEQYTIARSATHGPRRAFRE